MTLLAYVSRRALQGTGENQGEHQGQERTRFVGTATENHRHKEDQCGRSSQARSVEGLPAPALRARHAVAATPQAARVNKASGR